MDVIFIDGLMVLGLGIGLSILLFLPWLGWLVFGLILVETTLL